MRMWIMTAGRNKAFVEDITKAEEEPKNKEKEEEEETKRQAKQDDPKNYSWKKQWSTEEWKTWNDEQHKQKWSDWKNQT